MSYNYDLKTCTVLIEENYVVNQVKEGVHVEIEQIKLVHELIEKHLGNNPYIYISDRKFSYSVNPLVYNFISTIKNMEVVITVIDNKTKLAFAQFENQFYNKTIMIFEHLEDATSWVKNYFKNMKRS